MNLLCDYIFIPIYLITFNIHVINPLTGSARTTSNSFKYTQAHTFISGWEFGINLTLVQRINHNSIHKQDLIRDLFRNCVRPWHVVLVKQLIIN